MLNNTPRDVLKNKEVNFVILAICNTEVVEDLIQRQVVLYGNVLLIYDSIDPYGGSCEELFSVSRDKGLNRYNEIALEVGTGHGILYKLLDERIAPTIRWARQP